MATTSLGLRCTRDRVVVCVSRTGVPFLDGLVEDPPVWTVDGARPSSVIAASHLRTSVVVIFLSCMAPNSGSPDGRALAGYTLLGVGPEGLDSGGRVDPPAGEGLGLEDLQPALGVHLAGEPLGVLPTIGALVAGPPAFRAVRHAEWIPCRGLVCVTCASQGYRKRNEKQKTG
jgi:hypothetical protein